MQLTQVSYLIMMYISVLPIAISVRRTNVYEEQSLGVYAKENAEGVDESAAIKLCWVAFEKPIVI